MTLSYVGAAGAASTSVTPPTGNVGDLLLVFAFRSGVNTAPTLPSGWTNLDNGGSGGEAFRVGYKIATSTVDSSGTWTNATDVTIVRVAGAATDPAWIGGQTRTSNSTATITYGAVTLIGTTGNMLISFAGAVSATSIPTQTGFTRDASTGSGPILVTEHQANPTGGSNTVTPTGTTGAWFEYRIEVLPGSNTTAATAAPTVTATAAAGANRKAAAAAGPTVTTTATAVGHDTRKATATPTVTTTLTAAAHDTRPAAATPTVTAGLTTAPTSTGSRAGAVTPTVTATATPAGHATRKAVATPTVTVTATPAAHRIRQGAAAFGVTVTAAATSKHTAAGAAQATVTATLAPTPATHQAAAAAATVRAELAATGHGISDSTRDLDLTVGEPYTAWTTTPPTLGWNTSSPRTGWTTSPART